MKKEIQISAKLDTQEFDRTITQLQNKLKELQSGSVTQMQSQTAGKMQSAGFGGVMSKPAMDEFNRATQQQKREMDQFIREQAKSQESLSKVYAQRLELIKKLQDKQKEMNEGTEEELRLREKISKVEENTSRLKQKYVEGDKVLNSALGGQSGANNPQQMMSFFKGLGTAMAATGAVLGAASYGSGAQLRQETARGSAIQNTTGQDLQTVFGGRAGFEAAFMPERNQAAGLAKDKSKINEQLDKAKGMVAGTLVAGGLLALGLGTGGLGLLGAGSALAAGGGTLAYSDKIRNGLGSMLPGSLGQHFGDKYQTLQAADQAKDFRQSYEDLKNQDPLKKYTMEWFEQNMQRNLGAQRGLGIGTKAFYGEGGFLNQNAQAGFSNDQAIQMSQGILGAGGSTGMARNALFGNQLQRQGITNSAGILGSLSGSIQNPESSKNATISILSEAFKVGLDNTQFAEENRRFAQAAATIIGKSGASGADDQDRITNLLGRFLGERTNSGVEAAGSAYEAYQGRNSQLGGRRGAMRLAEARKNPMFEKVNTQDLTELLGARPDQLREDSSFLRSYATQTGKSPQELLEALGQVGESSRFLIPGNKKEASGYSDKINKFMKEKGINRSQFVEMSRNNQLPTDIDEAYGRLQRVTSREESGGFNVQGIEAQTNEFIGGFGGTTASDKEATKKLIEGPGTRVEDRVNTENARGADQAREAFAKLAPEIYTLIKSTKELAEAQGAAADVAHQRMENRRGSYDMGNGINPLNNLNQFYTPLQPQAGKDSK